MNPSSFIITPIYLLILSSLLLIQSPQQTQSIVLSRLCGRYGHACFGANWGKRTLPTESSSKEISTNLNTNDIEPAMSSGRKYKTMNNDDLDELRWKLFRQRLLQLLTSE